MISNFHTDMLAAVEVPNISKFHFFLKTDIRNEGVCGIETSGTMLIPHPLPIQCCTECELGGFNVHGNRA